MLDYIIKNPIKVVEDFHKSLIGPTFPKSDLKGYLYRAYFIDYTNIKLALNSVALRKPIITFLHYIEEAKKTAGSITETKIIENINSLFPTLVQHQLNNYYSSFIDDRTLSVIQDEMDSLTTCIFGNQPPLKVEVINTKESDKVFKVSIKPI